MLPLSALLLMLLLIGVAVDVAVIGVVELNRFILNGFVTKVNHQSINQ